MTRTKQIIYPLIIIVVGVAAFIGFSSMKKPPEEKPPVDNTPLVRIAPVEIQNVAIEVPSYGVVSPKYETEMVAQVSGQIVHLAESFQRGGYISKGQLLAKIDPSDYEAALIEAEASLASAQASLEQEIAQGKVAENEWKRIKNNTPTELSLRKPQLAQELARVKAAEASVKRAKRNLERTEIIAPYDALIESRSVGLGSVVSSGTRLGKVLSTSSAEVRLPVADKQMQYIEQQGVGANVVLSSNLDGVYTQWEATIVRNEGVVDSKSRMGYLVAEIKDPYSLASEGAPLKYGTYINAKIQGISVSSATVIPRHLVNNKRVATLDSDNKLHYQTVEIIREEGNQVIIGQGLNEGDRLIVSALDYPVEGMQLALPKPDVDSTETDTAEEQIAMKKE